MLPMNVNVFLLDHFHDLAEQSFEKGTVFSSFLSLDEQHLLFMHKKDFQYVEYRYHKQEDYLRRMLCFGEPKAYPILLLKASHPGEITHRDVLGSFMSLGLERSTLGNIKVTDEAIYLEILEHVAPLVERELTQVKRAEVSFKRTDEEVDFTPRMKAEEVIISSNRLDAVLSGLYKLSRQDAKELIDHHKVMIQRREARAAVSLVEGDVVSVRGFGKFIYQGVLRQTKKERYVVNLHVFT